MRSFSEMYLPASTYRLQLNKEFTFKDLQQVLPYLISMSPGAIYASPVFKAVPGSKHGYDVTNPHRINPEIGTPGEYSELIEILHKNGVGWLQDIVPNHMAFHPDNEWLMDVMRFGRKSQYADFFDIDWNHPVYRNKVMVPVLGDTKEYLLKNGQITVRLLDSEIWFTYGDIRLPVGPASLKSFSVNYPAMDALCAALNADLRLLDSLLNRQHYILTSWQEVDTTINYRRFFTINGLISLKMENKKVYQKYHEFIFGMAQDGAFNGIRLDHVDGLQKPVEYFGRLRADLGRKMYIISEKILEVNEKADPYWPIQGTTGYDFMATVNSLFTGKGIISLTAFYRKTTGIDQEPEEIIYRAKHAILKSSFRGDLDNIYRMISERGLIRSTSLTAENIKEALGELLVCCPVYKLYSDALPLHAEDKEILKTIFRQAKKNKPHLKDALLALEDLFNTANPANTDLFLRLMQYTGPLMAKGVEDTAMYTWVPHIARNEVGDSLSAPALSVSEFHNLMIERRKNFSASVNATSTHDTKRGEDTRARLSVVSDIPSDWIRFYTEWSYLARELIRQDEKSAPDENEMYFICQVIIGSLPMNGRPDKTYLTRLQEYVRKALREAKINTDWNTPDEEYENAVFDFCERVLNNQRLVILTMNFIKHIREFGIINSLAQVILKSTCPGIPDFYQGTELWDLSFVDPDNRRLVDYNLRKDMIDAMNLEINKNESGFLDNLYRRRFTGTIKLWLIHRLMNERFKDPIAFVDGDYIALKTTGKNSGKILAFLRVYRQKYYAVIVPLHLAAIENKENFNDLKIHLPIHAPDTWRDLWDNRLIKSNDHQIAGNVLRKNIPLVLKGHISETQRGSGILMHITSLPGKYGVGSLGQEALDFIGMLKRSGQKFWQFLPFNPPGAGYSPYSSPSAFAGNVLFIDPFHLFKQRLLKKLPGELPAQTRADFKKSMAIRNELFIEAYHNFILHPNAALKKDFEEFCFDNSYWLDDYALFTSISSHHGVEWIKWPGNLKNHENKSLRAYSFKYQEDIERRKFIQFLFHQQFIHLKSFAASSGIRLIGDIPMYISYNSSDVWSHRNMFNLDAEGWMNTVSGVPPDFFSSTGQLWNMPVFNWKKIRQGNYKWWIQRIRRNLAYCDLVRLDHFRALSAYWEVPSGESTARRGKWTPGPGRNFLDALKTEFSGLPLIAEDLGDIDEDVLKLRDLYELPGMKVLMFAFDAGLPRSFHIPHNYSENSVAYTGTHDNDTVKGWYSRLDTATRERINAYMDKRVSKATISWDLIRQALTSVCRMSVIPLQDILSLDENSRMNIPAQKRGNWTWKLADFSKLEKVCDKLLNLTYYSGRI